VYEDLKDPEDAKDILSQTAVLKLNGGLGTSMGLEKAKSLLPVKDGKTFLDLIAEQVRCSLSITQVRYSPFHSAKFALLYDSYPCLPFPP
jgi:UTP--glucose-1-phosphate uridylyltransferase